VADDSTVRLAQEATMKRLVVVGALIAFAGAASAQTPATGQPSRQGGAAAAGEGHKAPKTQPGTAPEAAAPSGDVQLGSVTLPMAVRADGKPLKAGTYQLRLTTQAASGDAKGATAALERWVEFVRAGKVEGREVATIIPQTEVASVQKDTAPRPNQSKVEKLAGGDFVRVWVNKGGNHYLLYLPPGA
jgi:hypothetical protein